MKYLTPNHPIYALPSDIAFMLCEKLPRITRKEAFSYVNCEENWQSIEPCLADLEAICKDEILWQHIRYELLARSLAHRDFRFMNHGIYQDNIYLFHKHNLHGLAEFSIPCALLYLEAARYLNIKPGQSILDIGCGFSGGIRQLAKIFSKSHFIGLERCKESINFANSLDHDIKNISLLNLSAEKLRDLNLPINSIINIESSHCYKNEEDFLKSVYEILPSNGKFVIADVRRKEDLQSFYSSIKKVFKNGICYQKDITDLVINGINFTLNQGLPVYESNCSDIPKFVPFLKERLAQKIKLYTNSEHVYSLHVLQKKAIY